MTSGWRLWLAVAGVAVLFVAVTVLLAAPRREGPPLDPRSHGADGTAALLDVARELGADVRIADDLPDAGRPRVALVLLDDLDDPQREEVREWVADGGTLLVADPTSPLVPAVAGVTAVGFLDPPLTRGCDVAALAAVDTIAAPGSAVYDVPSGATGCFSRGEGAWLVVRAEGAGTVVALGGPAPLTNAQLSRADNGLLAASLLAPRPGTVVTVLEPALPGSGEDSLLDLVPVGVRLAVIQLGVAFLALALWRGRRLGPPVVEPQPVELPGSELVVAVGNLYQHAAARRRAAEALRADLRRALAERLGLPTTLRDEAVADAVALRLGDRVDRDRVLAALAGPAPGDDAGLVRLSQELSALRRTVLEVKGDTLVR